MNQTITMRKIRNYLIFLSICLGLLTTGIYVYLVPAFHPDFVTMAALHPSTCSPDKPIKDTTAGITASPVQFTVMREGRPLILSGAIYKTPGAKQIMLYSHGNAGCIDNRFDNFRIACAIKENFSVFIYDYEGYGRSQGKPGYSYLIDDARAAYNYLRNHGYSAQDIVLYGESLGGGVSTELARQMPVKALLLDCTFTSPEGWAKHRVPAAHIYPSFCFPTPHYDNLDFLRNKHPLCLVVSAENDSSIPIEHAREMQAKAVGQTMFLHLPQSQHCYVEEADRPAFATTMTKFAAALRSPEQRADRL